MDTYKTAIFQHALQAIALELVNVLATHEVETVPEMQWTGAAVAGLLGLGSDQVGDGHPMPEAVDIGQRQRARFLGDPAGVAAAQERIDAARPA